MMRKDTFVAGALVFTIIAAIVMIVLLLYISVLGLIIGSIAAAEAGDAVSLKYSMLLYGFAIIAVALASVGMVALARAILAGRSSAWLGALVNGGLAIMLIIYLYASRMDA